MNKRLERIMSYIENGIGMIDVGTDHGYLPLELWKSGYNGNIYASDINEDPLSKAVNAAQCAGADGRIVFLLCDGLTQCPPEKIDTIVIAGMGGDTICDILDKAEWCMDDRFRLILQPMTKSEVLRYWLVNNGFSIDAEELVFENETIYQIIICSFGGITELNDAELYSGEASLCKDKALFDKQKILLKKRFEKALSGMIKAQERDMDGKIKLTKDIIEQFERME